MNEELWAANDQLNLLNEELATANAQLRLKIEELKTQSNVLSSGEVMTLFLDAELQVQWFTPAVQAMFPLLSLDIKHRITNFVQRFDDAAFVDDVLKVMQDELPCEAEVRNVEGKWFLRRIYPFLAGSGQPAGIAATFTDISVRRQAEGLLRESEQRYRHFITASSDIVYKTSPDWNEMQSLEGKDFLADTSDPSRTWIKRYIPEDDRNRVSSRAIPGYWMSSVN